VTQQPQARYNPAELTAAPGSRQEELLAAYESAKAAKEDAVARFESVSAALKNVMTATAPNGSTDITLAGSPGLPRLRLRWLAPWRFDSKRFKAERPEDYVRYEVQGGHWDMRVVD
jgi:hypothetical protein